MAHVYQDPQEFKFSPFHQVKNDRLQPIFIEYQLKHGKE